MKKTVILIFVFLLPISVSICKAQFYDIKTVRQITVVGTQNESSTVLETPKAETGAYGVPTIKNTDIKQPESPFRSDSMSIERYFSAPIDTLIVTSPYGYRKDPISGKRKFHAGTDYLTFSENVYSMMPGRIKKIGYDKRLGNYVTLVHGNMEVTYAHLHTVVGDAGEFVAAGQSVGISGSTGRSTGEHLHVSIRYKNERLDPDPIIRLICQYALRNNPSPLVDNR